MTLSPATRYTHPGLGSSDLPDFTRLICRDCSTRSTVVVIPADERADHNAWHDAQTVTVERPAPTRHAVVKGGHADAEAIRRYLPSNYWCDSDGGNVWIHGTDNAGWSLDGYVIPRLASGLYFAKEVQV